MTGSRTSKWPISTWSRISDTLEHIEELNYLQWLHWRLFEPSFGRLDPIKPRPQVIRPFVTKRNWS